MFLQRYDATYIFHELHEYQALDLTTFLHNE